MNHSVNFVDPTTGVQIQNAESNWGAAKENLKKIKGNSNSNFLQEYLREFTWRRWGMESHTQMVTFKESYMPLRNNILYNKISNLVPRVSILPVPWSERERDLGMVWSRASQNLGRSKEKNSERGY